MTNLGIYLHVPFCVQKCHYCDFLSAPATKETMQVYMDALCEDMEQQSREYQEYIVDTVFFGGGTPSILPVCLIEQCMEKLYQCFVISENAEITMECNPGTVDFDALVRYKAAGINRISFGLQSTENDDLKRLGRIHTYETFLQSYQDARRAGFTNISMDLMASLPGQDVDKFRSILEKTLALEPDHLSVYSLILEEGTRFYQWFVEEEGRGMPGLPDEDEDRAIYQMTKEVLEAHGMQRYEISNYAKPGYESKHNVKYWNRSEYLGLGLGAASMTKNTRWHETRKLQDYIKRDFSRQEEEILSVEDCMSEFMFLGLRMMQGVSKTKFYEVFGQHMDDVFEDSIMKHETEGLLTEEDDFVKLTLKGIDLSNYVMSDFLLS